MQLSKVNLAQNDNIDEQLINALHQVLPCARLAKTPIPLLQSYFPAYHLWLIDESFCHEDLTPETIKNLWDNCPYWIFAWASGQILSQYIFDHPNLVKDKIVMDFGAGSGIVGISAKLAGAKQAICCDIDPVSLVSCMANAHLNNVTIDLLPNLFDLHRQFGLQKVDVLLVADVLYDKANLALLDILLNYADEIWIADSRVKNFSHGQYQKIAILDDTTTVPDMDEAKHFNSVAIYKSLH